MLKKTGWIIILIGFWLGVWYLSLIFSESKYVERGSIPYYLLIPNEIQEMLLLDKKNLSYYYSAGDGTKQARSAVNYVTGLPKENIMKQYNRYFSKWNGNMEAFSINTAIVKFPEQTWVFLLKVETNNGENKVTIESIH